MDRYLCSSAHLSPSFAGYVLAELIEPSVRAASPACGVDLVALGRHARSARARVTQLRRSMAAALGSALMMLLVAVSVRSATLLLLALIIAVAGVHLAVFFDRLSLYRTLGAMVSPVAQLRDLAPPLPARDEDRLDALNASNVVIFEGGNTFVALGRRLRDGWQMSLDATKPATDSNGNKRTVLPFTPADLHKAVTLAVRTAGVPGVEAHNRLFVASHSADAVPGLLPNQFGRPAATVPSNAVRLGIEKPRPDIRTYLCVEKTSWGGELVVNLYLRAAMVSGDLFIECHAFVLLPLRAELTTIDHMPTGAAEMIFRSARDALGATSAPRRMWHEVKWERRAARRRRKDLAEAHRAIRKHRPVSRGAGLSIRAAAANDERVFLFAYTDESMHLNALQRRVLNAIEDFLDQHGVDTADFHQKQTNIVNNHTYEIGAVNAQHAQVGSGNVQNNTPPQNDPAPWALN
ncbi:hypothetical protein [Luedemannella helvata]|uniref:hypothetical protein n=1 Tax=Luedemannella helvata TaxID=349315 RepID=UPI0031E46E50